MDPLGTMTVYNRLNRSQVPNLVLDKHVGERQILTKCWCYGDGQRETVLIFKRVAN